MRGYLYLLFTLVSFLASGVGTVCGIGGGVIIKPVLDAFGVLSVSTISFFSGCTVLSMSLYSILRSKISGDSMVDARIGTPLAVGAAIGGVAGKAMFQSIAAMFADKDQVGAVQAACLLVITLATLIYTLNKDRIKTHKISSRAVCAVIGFSLGILSSFLGIGGGPINLVVLYYFFTLDTKTAAQNSLYIILFSQLTSLAGTLVTRTVPAFSAVLLVLMVMAGILGGICGRYINKRIDVRAVEQLFIAVMAVIIGINAYNIYRFMV